jgi:hypothetical protein
MSAAIAKQIDFLEAAKAEERRLLAELHATPAYRRLEAIRATLNAYKDDLGLASTNPAKAEPGLTATTPAQQPTSKRSIWLNGATNYLRQKGARATSGELVQALISRGIDLGSETNPAWKLSSILSGSPLFDNVRGEGYGLTEWPKRATKPGTSAAADHASTSRLA